VPESRLLLLLLLLLVLLLVPPAQPGSSGGRDLLGQLLHLLLAGVSLHLNQQETL
jgi:hypothetical protein